MVGQMKEGKVTYMNDKSLAAGSAMLMMVNDPATNTCKDVVPALISLAMEKVDCEGLDWKDECNARFKGDAYDLKQKIILDNVDKLEKTCDTSLKKKRAGVSAEVEKIWAAGDKKFEDMMNLAAPESEITAGSKERERKKCNAAPDAADKAKCNKMLDLWKVGKVDFFSVKALAYFK